MLMVVIFIFFFNMTTTTEIYTLSLHDALPIYMVGHKLGEFSPTRAFKGHGVKVAADRDRKSTRLNSSHRCISYAVFCLKKKKLYGIAVRHSLARRTATVDDRLLAGRTPRTHDS